MSTPGGATGPDGKVRLCGLHPGDYELTVSQWDAGSLRRRHPIRRLHRHRLRP